MSTTLAPPTATDGPGATLRRSAGSADTLTNAARAPQPPQPSSKAVGERLDSEDGSSSDKKSSASGHAGTRPVSRGSEAFEAEKRAVEELGTSQYADPDDDYPDGGLRAWLIILGVRQYSINFTLHKPE
jgi:hypothetical protein